MSCCIFANQLYSLDVRSSDDGTKLEQAQQNPPTSSELLSATDKASLLKDWRASKERKAANDTTVGREE